MINFEFNVSQSQDHHQRVYFSPLCRYSLTLICIICPLLLLVLVVLFSSSMFSFFDCFVILGMRDAGFVFGCSVDLRLSRLLFSFPFFRSSSCDWWNLFDFCDTCDLLFCLKLPASFEL